MTTASASGKVILVGEHAVVYGVPAIAVGVDRGARAHARLDAANDHSHLALATSGDERAFALRVRDDQTHEPLGRALAALLASVRAKHDIGHVEIIADTDLPAGAGLGCSAALGVAIARAVCGLASKEKPSDDEAREHAMAWERIFHGNPSGVDAAVAALGGAIVFARDGDRSVVESIVVGSPIVLAVGHSGVASSTRSMVEHVARQHARQPAMVQKTFDAIAAVVRNARLALEAGDVRAVGKLLDMNQMLLAGLLLSTQEIESMCEAARGAGALGAKLTGAGGGGCVIALVETRATAERVLATWKASGYDGFVAAVGAPAERDRATVETRAPEASG